MQFDPEVTSINLNLVKIRDDLRMSLVKCQVRGLVNSASWLAELLLSVQQNLPKSDATDAATSSGFLLAMQYDGLSLENFSKYSLAKCYFDNREYSRSGHLLASVSSAGSHPLIDFLHFYSRYMSIEKRITDESITNREGSANQPESYPLEAYRKSLFELKTDIERKYGAEEVIQGTSLNIFLSSEVDLFTAYVHALIHIRLGFRKPALKILSHIVKKDPLLWPAWFEMTKLFGDRESLDLFYPPLITVDSTNWMRATFRAKALLHLQDTERALAILTSLSNAGFQNSLNLQADIADAHERLRDLDVSVTIYKNIFTVDPYRLTDADIFSNVLFVKADHEELAFLARRCSEVDKYRPETCCVLGNFYGLRGQHDKAVLYFQRALRLQPKYVLVWILLGHEYVELQHLKLAIYAYNQAIMHNRHDHRGWYGLGQLYEFIKQPQHALYYYKRAQYLCPSDSRVIVALGDMYEQQGNVECAKMCFWRAYCVGDVEGTALFSLARCYEKTGNDCEAAAAYTQFIRQCEARGVSNETDLGQAYRFLANYHFKYGHHSDAVVAINKCLDFPEIREEAKALCLQMTLISGSVSGASGDGPQAALPPAITSSTPEARRNATIDLLADRPRIRARRRFQTSDFTTIAQSSNAEGPATLPGFLPNDDNISDFS